MDFLRFFLLHLRGEEVLDLQVRDINEPGAFWEVTLKLPLKVSLLVRKWQTRLHLHWTLLLSPSSSLPSEPRSHFLDDVQWDGPAAKFRHAIGWQTGSAAGILVFDAIQSTHPSFPEGSSKVPSLRDHTYLFRASDQWDSLKPSPYFLVAPPWFSWLQSLRYCWSTWRTLQFYQIQIDNPKSLSISSHNQVRGFRPCSSKLLACAERKWKVSLTVVFLLVWLKQDQQWISSAPNPALQLMVSGSPGPSRTTHWIPTSVWCAIARYPWS